MQDAWVPVTDQLRRAITQPAMPSSQVSVSPASTRHACARAAHPADISRAVFYPEDDRFLVDRETTVTHFEVQPEP